jgi:hypothetical protein
MSKYTARPKDAHGARKGTVAAKVNAAMSKSWQTVAQIQEKVRAPKDSVKARLYSGAHKGIYQRQSVIRFKLKRQ